MSAEQKNAGTLTLSLNILIDFNLLSCFKHKIDSAIDESILWSGW